MIFFFFLTFMSFFLIFNNKWTTKIKPGSGNPNLGTDPDIYIYIGLGQPQLTEDWLHREDFVKGRTK
jgi:hypothetical protein